MNKIKTFEQIWEEAETINPFKSDNLSQIIENIKLSLSNYNDISISSLPEEIKSSLKSKYMGEVLFFLTGISIRDNINIYVALKKEIEENKIKI
jgi:hypothetical protein